MSRRPSVTAVCGVCLVWCGAGSVPADEVGVSPAAGYTVGRRISVPPGASGGGAAYLADGSIVTYDSGSGQILRHGPGEATPLATFDPPVFGSYLVRSADGSHLVFGENTNGGIYTIGLEGGGAVLLDRITFNYDLAFDAEGHGFVSAPGLSGGNSIRLLDADPANDSKELVILLAGFSGPVAVDGAGDLYYGTATGGPESLLRFSRELLAVAIEGQPLVEADAEILATEIGSFYNLRWAGDVLIHSDLGFGSGRSFIYGLDPADEFSSFPIASFEPSVDRLTSATFLDFRPGTRPFRAGAGPEGGAIITWVSDFAAVNELVEIVPELHFVRGRVNSDDEVDISDAIALLGFLFNGETKPGELAAADINADGVLDLSDSVFLLDFLFRGGPTIPAPFPDPGPAQ